MEVLESHYRARLGPGEERESVGVLEKVAMRALEANLERMALKGLVVVLQAFLQKESMARKEIEVRLLKTHFSV